MKYERMTANEIRRSYAEAKDPKAQIKILAELNLCKPEDIVAIIEHRADELPNAKTPKGLQLQPRPKPATKKRLPPETWAEIARMYETGLYSQRKLADMFGLSPAGIGRHLKIQSERANEPMQDPPVPSLYEIAEELAQYIRHKHPDVDYISINRNGQTIRVVVENGKERIDIVKPRGEKTE